jgi:hypothetical protein
MNEIEQGFKQRCKLFEYSELTIIKIGIQLDDDLRLYTYFRYEIVDTEPVRWNPT